MQVRDFRLRLPYHNMMESEMVAGGSPYLTGLRHNSANDQDANGYGSTS